MMLDEYIGFAVLMILKASFGLTKMRPCRPHFWVLSRLLEGKSKIRLGWVWSDKMRREENIR